MFQRTGKSGENQKREASDKQRKWPLLLSTGVKIMWTCEQSINSHVSLPGAVLLLLWPKQLKEWKVDFSSQFERVVQNGGGGMAAGACGGWSHCTCSQVAEKWMLALSLLSLFNISYYLSPWSNAVYTHGGLLVSLSGNMLINTSWGLFPHL